MVRYRECQRNHAAHLGSHVVDGCGEFMPAGDEGGPQSLRCAACDCHRNFHRREVDDQPTTITKTLPPPPLLHPPTRNHAATTTPAGNCYISFNKPPPPQKTAEPIMMAFGGGGAAAESSSEDLMGGQVVMGQYGGAKKRFRTKFTEEQKEKMAEFTEKIGWKMAKQNEEGVVDLCNELGIKRQVFKVWMHNNKQAMKRKLP